MSLVVDAHKSVVNLGLRAASNAFVSHIPTDLNGQDRVQNYVARAQTRLEHRKQILVLTLAVDIRLTILSY